MQPSGYSGYDKGLSVLEQYGLTSEKTYRGRSALLCQTQQGLKLIRFYDGSASRLEKIYELQSHLKDTGHKNIDQFLRNNDGNLISTDKDGFSYIVKDWWDYKECDARSVPDVLKAVKCLAQVHKDMYLLPANEEKEEILVADLRENYVRHNQELKKIRDYIRHRKKKNHFEYTCLEHIPRYLQYGQDALSRLESSSYESLRMEAIHRGSICHHACTQHNFLTSRTETVLVNYEQCCYDNHMADLAQFMRKILEKHGWNKQLAQKLVEGYDAVHPLSKEEHEQLVIRLSYPEKFWKIINFYYNRDKAFFSEYIVDKLEHQLEHEKNWKCLIEDMQ